MLKETLKSIILSQQEWLNPGEKEIRREGFDRFLSLPPFAYIITGVRRSGKSTLLKQVMRQHASMNYFNFEDSRAAGFEVSDFHVIEEIFSEFSDSRMLFFDEIQNVPGWERYVAEAIEKKFTVVITGSNAQLLSSELGTKLTGRHLDFEVFPFSYREFLQYFSQAPSADTFYDYLQRGGFPGFLEIGKPEMLSTLVSDILVRDIYTRHNLRNHLVYNRIVQFLLSNTGKETSFNSLKNAFELGSASSAMDFVNYLINAYLTFLVPQFNTSLKVQARNPRKVYAIDPGLVNFSSVSGSPDNGRLLENSVFLSLRQSMNEIWYYKGKKECDFVYRDNKNCFSAMQVCWQVNKQNEKRELDGLVEALKSLNLKEGAIITFDQEDRLTHQDKAIRLLPGWKWMSQPVETKNPTIS
jgi:predicted AAA+ superfamily ATPase